MTQMSEEVFDTADTDRLKLSVLELIALLDTDPAFAAIMDKRMTLNDIADARRVVDEFRRGGYPAGEALRALDLELRAKHARPGRAVRVRAFYCAECLHDPVFTDGERAEGMRAIRRIRAWYVR